MDQRDHGDEQPETVSSGYTINECICGVNDQQPGEHHSPLCAGYTGGNMSMTEAFHPDELQQANSALLDAQRPIYEGDPIGFMEKLGEFFGLPKGNENASDKVAQ